MYLAEGPGVARGKKIKLNYFLSFKFLIFSAKNIPRPPMSIQKKILPNRSSCLDGYTQHIYICLFLNISRKKKHILMNF